MEHEGDGDTNSNMCSWNNLERLFKGTGNQMMSRDHPDYNIVKIG